jgi:hypothetical protein
LRRGFSFGLAHISAQIIPHNHKTATLVVPLFISGPADFACLSVWAVTETHGTRRYAQTPENSDRIAVGGAMQI